MPLPLLLVWLVQAALQVFARWAARAILAYAAEVLFEKLKAFALAWVEKYAPALVQYFLKGALGLDVDLPLSPDSLTRALNAKLGLEGDEKFHDITDRDQTRADAERIAWKALKLALPGVNIHRLSVARSKRSDMQAAILAAVRREIRTAVSSGQSTLLPATAVRTIMMNARGNYVYQKPPPPIDDVKHSVGRDMAAWWGAHFTKTWVPR